MEDSYIAMLKTIKAALIRMESYRLQGDIEKYTSHYNAIMEIMQDLIIGGAID